MWLLQATTSSRSVEHIARVFLHYLLYHMFVMLVSMDWNNIYFGFIHSSCVSVWHQHTSRRGLSNNLRAIWCGNNELNSAGRQMDSIVASFFPKEERNRIFKSQCCVFVRLSPFSTFEPLGSVLRNLPWTLFHCRSPEHFTVLFPTVSNNNMACARAQLWSLLCFMP